jgi:hypothetical protein
MVIPHFKRLLISTLIAISSMASGHTANEVWFEFRDNGRFRVFINYTIPDLKEFREVYVDFTNQKKAESFYWHVVRGGEFHQGSPNTEDFHKVPRGPNPW